MAKKQKTTFNTALQAYLRYAVSIGLRETTLTTYRNTFRHFQNFLSASNLAEKPFTSLTSENIEEFLTYMIALPVTTRGSATLHVPARVIKQRRSNRTLSDYCIPLSAMWTWAVNHGHTKKQIVIPVRKPKHHRRPIHPLTEDQVAAVLRAAEHSAEWRGKPGVRNSAPSAARNAAMISVFVETMIRVKELVRIQWKHVTINKTVSQIWIPEGKGHKSRHVTFTIHTLRRLNRYLLERDEMQPDDYLFTNDQRSVGRMLKENNVYKRIRSIGDLAGIDKLGCHDLRTTGACLFVRNGGTAFELQRLMGHKKISTTLLYVAAAKIDLDQAMIDHSPLKNVPY